MNFKFTYVVPGTQFSIRQMAFLYLRDTGEERNINIADGSVQESDPREARRPKGSLFLLEILPTRLLYLCLALLSPQLELLF